jgi:hypothetical protein
MPCRRDLPIDRVSIELSATVRNPLIRSRSVSQKIALSKAGVPSKASSTSEANLWYLAREINRWNQGNYNIPRAAMFNSRNCAGKQIVRKS